MIGSWPRVSQAVDFGALGHDQRVADAGDPVREVTPRVLLDQAGHYVLAEGVDVGAHRGVMHGIHRPLPEHAVRLAAVVLANLPAARVGRVPIDADHRQRRRVGVAGVVRGVHHADRVVRRRLVELVAQQHLVAEAGQLSRAVTQSPNPLPVGAAVRGGGQRVEHRRLARQRRRAAVDRARLKRGHREVVVGIAEAGDQGAPLQIDLHRVGPDRLTRRAAVAHRNNPPIAHRDAGDNPIERVHRQHAPTSEEHFHPRPPD